MKSRITITLDQAILKRIDRLIDHHEIRNRSHAIEHLIHQSLAPSVRTAVILAGGKKHGQSLPPALVPLEKQPLIIMMLSHFKRFGIKNVIICPGPWEKEFQKLLAENKSLAMEVSFFKEARPLGTAGVLKKARPLFNGEPFLIFHGDVLTTLDLTNFIAFHEHEQTLATMAVKPRIAEKNYGKVLLQGNKITDFLDKKGDRGISIVNTGIYLMNPEVIDFIPNHFPTNLETDLFPRLARLGELGAYLFQGLWVDTSRPFDKRAVLNRWQKEQRR